MNILRKHKVKMLKVYKRKFIKIPAWAKHITITYKTKQPKFILKVGKLGIEADGYKFNPKEPKLLSRIKLI